MTLLTGLTADGTEVPVQVKPDGTLIAEGLEGPPGADGSDATNYWTKNGSDLYYDAGKLGLGTSSPSSLLDVEGIVTAKAGAFDAGGFLNKYGSDANSRSWWVKTDTHGFGDFAIRQSTTQSGSSYDTKLLIDGSGNVGIGTTQPSRALDVMGAVGATDGYYLRSPNGTWWQLTVDDTGALATTAAPVVKANDLYSRTRGNLAP